jgi:hypothetical protein
MEWPPRLLLVWPQWRGSHRVEEGGGREEGGEEVEKPNVLGRVTQETEQEQHTCMAATTTTATTATAILALCFTGKTLARLAVDRV